MKQHQIFKDQDSYLFQFGNRQFQSRINHFFQDQDKFQSIQDSLISDFLVFQKKPHSQALCNVKQNIEGQIKTQNKYKVKDLSSSKRIQKSNKRNQSSKNYRQRKKEYYLKMQYENIQLKKRTYFLEQQIRNLQKQLIQQKCYIQKQQKATYDDQYELEISSLLEKIQIAQDHDQELAIQANKLKAKYGPAGSHRTQILNYHMSQYINNCLADGQKYLFMSAITYKGLMGTTNSESFLDKKVNQIFGDSHHQRQEISTFLNDMRVQVINYRNYSLNIYKNYIGFLDEANKFQSKMLRSFQWFKYNKIPHFLLWFHQNKHHPQVRKLRQQWFQMFTDPNYKVQSF